MKADEEVIEKAWKSVIEWEEGEGRKKEEGGRDVKEVVEKEMSGFRRIVDDFEVRFPVFLFFLSIAGRSSLTNLDH